MKLHNVERLDFEGPQLVLTVDGKTYHIDLGLVSDRLAQAKEHERRQYDVSPSGFGIHWPMVDEDLTVNGLIAAARQTYPKTLTGTLLIKEEPPKKFSSLIQHVDRVIQHVQKTNDQFEELTINKLKTAPIPFFGDIDTAQILTVGVNPSCGEFQGRNWPESEMSARNLELRLRNYFRSVHPKPHPWFRLWESALNSLNGASYRTNAAHLDLSPRATRAVRDLPAKEFLKMVKDDLEMFFETLLFCKHARVLLLAGTVINTFYLNEFLRDYSPNFGFELRGSVERRRGGCMVCRHSLVSPKLNLPVFFFSRSPSYCGGGDTLTTLISQKKDEILTCLHL